MEGNGRVDTEICLGHEWHIASSHMKELKEYQINPSCVTAFEMFAMILLHCMYHFFVSKYMIILTYLNSDRNHYTTAPVLRYMYDLIAFSLYHGCRYLAQFPRELNCCMISLPQPPSTSHSFIPSSAHPQVLLQLHNLKSR